MKFKELYENCKRQLTDQVKGIWFENKDLWSSRNLGKTLIDYETDLNNLLDGCFTGDNILVEDMGEWESAAGFPTHLMDSKYWREWDNKEEYSAYGRTEPLQAKNYPPFNHQVKSWEKLLSGKSICVTTGTGSGKTECFMVPLVKDLAEQYAQRHNGGAITHPIRNYENADLVGVNAEQQGTDDELEPLQAIFLYPLNALMDDQRIRMSECIECSGVDLNFAVYNGNTPEDGDDNERNADAVDADRKRHELVFRSEIRSKKHPNILFTNPTMLEYMLLRSEDKSIIKHSKKKLRWIVIDETHTFSGAGAAELALLIRRVLDTFDTPIENVRFATSSATVGGNQQQKLKEFISKITGKAQNDIEIITGNRTLQSVNNISYNQLHKDTFLTLAEMCPNEITVEDKLDKLDQLCDAGLKVKLHLFAKALNRGLFADVRGGVHNDMFDLLDKISLDPNTGTYDEHILPASYCNQCGAVFVNGKIVDDKLTRDIVSTTSIFDNVEVEQDENEEDDDNSNNTQDSDNNENVVVTFNNNVPSTPLNGEIIEFDLANDMVVTSGNKYIRYQDCECPVCSGKNTIRRFNVAADKVARILAPSLLEQAEPVQNPQNLLFEGKQMIAFADSRQKAAKPTLKQNKESERKWVEWVVYKKLSDQAKSQAEIINDLEEDLKTEQERERKDPNERHRKKIAELEFQLRAARNNTLSWNDALDALYDDSKCDFFAKQFASKDDINANGNCSPEYKRKYVLAALYEVFKYRNKNALTAETNGQIKLVYPKLENLRQQCLQQCLPQEVIDLNNEINNPAKEISIDDWIDLLTLYIDYKIRTNECLYFRRTNSPDWNNIDITVCRNLRTTNGVRRTVKKGSHNKVNRYKKLLCNLLGTRYEQLNSNQKEIVDNVLDLCWDKLWREEIIQRGEIYIDNGWYADELDSDYAPNEQGRMNVTNISFTLPDKVWKCPVTNRYLTTTFKEYTPYDEDVRNGLYDKIATTVNNVSPIVEPKLFIQSEHTAQLGRTQTKERTKDFKNHKINILSCSTTMEMGVDLGSVLLVEMTNIPPHPSNYKQRAGRAGRRGQPRSACLTICGSDGVDSRFFADSKANVTKSIEPPTVDLNSPQLIQRHINSYLFKQWCNTLNLGSEVLDLFTPYSWPIDPTTNIPNRNLVQNGNCLVSPNGANNRQPYDTNHTFYAGWADFVSFLNKLRLNSPITNQDNDIRNGLLRIIDGSIYSAGKLDEYVRNTANAIEKIWNEEIDGYFLTLKQNQADAMAMPANNQKKIKAIDFAFTSRLAEPLLTFLSNHQFLPNANMPVNIVEMKVSDAKGPSRSNENPSYDLATALGQWAPGNYITIKDTTYQIGGVQHSYTKSWVEIRKCADCGHTWISKDQKCPSCGKTNFVKWTVNGTADLKLLEPTAFVPTTDRSRITDNNKNYTSAKAELIGASPMQRPARGLFAHRISNSNNTTSQILMYNDGNGFGYRICRKCGKLELETGPANPQNDIALITSFYKNEKDAHTRYHCDLIGREKSCFFDINKDNLDDKLFRNMIIGGLIQTDYCEIGFYKKNGVGIEPFDKTDRKILTTLGVMFCSFMVDEGICERKDIDFIVTGAEKTNALCIYDKAKGGAGYSNQLNQNLIERALDYCRGKLSGRSLSLFNLLDTYSQRFADQIDIKATKEWLDEEFNNRTFIPQNVSAAYNGASASSFIDIKQTLN